MKEYDSRKYMLQDLLNPGAVIAEIGVFTGDFSEWILQTLQPKKLHGVDPYTSTIGVMGSGDQDGYNMEYFNLEILYTFVKNRFYSHPEVEIHREFSHTFFQKIEDGSLDAVYIDGDHSLEAVMSDLKAARFAVKEGGWIFGHDYDLHTERGNPNVTHVTKKAVDDFCKEYGLELYAVANDGLRSYAIQNTNKYKICIVSLSNRSELYSKTFALLESYAKKHNYDLSLHTDILCDERAPTWSKIPAILSALNKDSYDFVVWMDDDMVITNPELPLSHFIDTYHFRKSDALIMVSSDMPTEPSTFMNCGMMFCKAMYPFLPKLLSFLDLVWNYPEDHPITKFHYAHEQEAFNFYYRFSGRAYFLIVPLPNFQAFTRFDSDPKLTWKPGMFAAHLNCGGLETKLQVYKLLKKVCDLP